jgi:HemY protein
LRDQCAEGDWRGARETLEKLSDSRAIDAATARRWRAVLLTAEAMGLEDKNPDEAARLAGEAHKLAPDLVPAAVIAARLAAHAGDVRRASRIVEETWRREPHPDLAEVYAYARPGDSPRDRLRRVKALARSWETHAESAIAVARAAIEAHDWAAAREALEPLAEKHPTERVCTLMAQIAEGSGDAGRVREWLARALRAPRDPAWTADGVVSDHWLPVSPVTGELDAFRWRVPVEDIESPVIEADQARFKPLPILTDRSPAPEPESIAPVPERAAPAPHASAAAEASTMTEPSAAAAPPETTAPRETIAPRETAAPPTAAAPSVPGASQAPSPKPATASTATAAPNAAAVPSSAAAVPPSAAAAPAAPAAGEAPVAQTETSAPPFRTSPAGLAGAAPKPGRNGGDKRPVVLARPPDDPGIEPPEAEDRGRFRLF